METKLIKVDGVTLVTPRGWIPRWQNLDHYVDCCGAGNGMGEKVIPDKLIGLRISAACNIHDYEFDHGDATWSEFHAINFRFIRNIYAIIRAKSKWGMGFMRTAMASVYFYSVDTKGAMVYERLKRHQGKEMKA